MTHNFRSAFRGFNREDVVHYIEYMNNRHKTEIEQLQGQLKNAQNQDLMARLEAAEARCKELEALVTGEDAVPNCTKEELEAYRRAEQAERAAKERAQQIRQQANAILADATVKAEEAAAHIGDLAAEMTAQLQKCQESVDATKATFRDAVNALYAICPEEE